MRNTAARTLAAPAPAEATIPGSSRIACSWSTSAARSHRRTPVSADRDRVDSRTIAVAAQGRPGGPAHSRARTFFKRDVVAVEKAPDHRRRHLLASRTLQTVADFVERKVRLAPMKAKQEIRVGLDALRTRVAAHRQRRVAAALAQRRHPTNCAGKARIVRPKGVRHCKNEYRAVIVRGRPYWGQCVEHHGARVITASRRGRHRFVRSAISRPYCAR